MTDKLFCPFCGQELEEEIFYCGRVFVSCNNPNCIISDWGGCSKQIITALINIKKKLDIAVDVLDFVWNHWADCDATSELGLAAKKALEQIKDKE